MSDIQAEIRTSADGLAHRGLRQNWLARLARAGMVAQGAMYVLVGGLAIERALLYASLCYSALALALSRGGGKSNTEDKATATVFDWPAGRWLVGAAGLAIVGYGLWNGYRALSRNFEKDLKVEQMSGGERRLVCAVGRAGFAARGIVFALIGIFVVKAALEYDPKEPVGLDGALQRLSEQPYGPALLGTVAAGLIAFGVFSLARARYREV